MATLPPALAQLAISAPLRLLKANQILLNRTMGGDKFGEELLRQLQQAPKTSQQNMLMQHASRPTSFIPGTSDAVPQQAGKNATSRRDGKKKQSGGSSGRPIPATSSKS